MMREWQLSPGWWIIGWLSYYLLPAGLMEEHQGTRVSGLFIVDVCKCISINVCKNASLPKDTICWNAAVILWWAATNISSGLGCGWCGWCVWCIVGWVILSNTRATYKVVVLISTLTSEFPIMDDIACHRSSAHFGGWYIVGWLSYMGFISSLSINWPVSVLLPPAFDADINTHIWVSYYGWHRMPS